jgi:GNAT superfamily N-acetyltransferase
MNIRFEETLPDKRLLFSLFLTAGWNAYYDLTEDELLTAFANSWYALFAWSEDRLVGMGRVICDQVCHALILDMIVQPDYQGRGIGGELLERLVEKCQAYNIRDIQLFAARDKAEFYRKRGFATRPGDAPGMEHIQGWERKLKGD